MSSGINRVTILGNLGHDPEVKALPKGKVASFSVATTETWRDRETQERKEKTDWHRCVTFSEPLIVTIEKFLKKGSRVLIDGAKIESRQYTGKDGVERHMTEIILRSPMS